MAIRRDLALDDSQDLIFKDNDFFIAESDEQHIQDTIESSPGWWKEFPTDGCDIVKYLNSPQSAFQFLSREILIQLTLDGYDVSNPIIVYDNQGRLNINPNATVRL